MLIGKTPTKCRKQCIAGDFAKNWLLSFWSTAVAAGHQEAMVRPRERD